MQKPRPRSIRTGHIEIHYLELGNPEGQPVFLLHGFPDAPSTWFDVAARLDLRRLRLILPFNRGTGETRVLLEDHLSGQVAALASDLLTLADALGLERFHIVGQDWGARTAFATAVLAPERVRGLLTLASGYIPYGNRTEPPAQAHAYWYQWYFNTAHGAQVFASDPVSFCEALWRTWSPTWDFSPREFRQAAQSFTNPQFVPIALHAYRVRWKGAPGKPPYDAADALLESKPKISVPTLFAFGTRDGANLPASSEEQAAWFTGPYRRIPLKNIGHFPQRESSKAVARLLQDLLRTTS